MEGAQAAGHSADHEPAADGLVSICLFWARAQFLSSLMLDATPFGNSQFFVLDPYQSRLLFSGPKSTRRLGSSR